MVGRNLHDFWGKGHFEVVPVKVQQGRPRIAARCQKCFSILKNTAQARLIAHRNICPIDGPSTREPPQCSNPNSKVTIKVDVETDNGDEESFVEDPLDFDDTSMSDSMTNVYSDNYAPLASNAIKVEPSTIQEPASIYPAPARKRRCCSNIQQPDTNPPRAFIHNAVTPKQKDEFIELLGNFMFGCNIPFSVIESDHFKNLVAELQPEYADKIPDQNTLTTAVLDDSYQKCIKHKAPENEETGVLIVSRPINDTSPVLCVLQKDERNKIFLTAHETALPDSKLADLITEAISLATRTHNTSIYATISSIPAKISNAIDDKTIWHLNCTIDIAAQLIEDCANSETTQKVKLILSKFQKSACALLNMGGKAICVREPLRYDALRNSYACILDNILNMQRIAISDSIDDDVTVLLQDNVFIDTVKQSRMFLDSVQAICTVKDISAACSVDLWLSVKCPVECPFDEIFKQHQKAALHIYALVAFYLHPNMNNAKLSAEHTADIMDYLMEALNGQGLEDLNGFQQRLGVFGILYGKSIENPLVFWNMAKLKHPNLANIALRMLKLPACAAEMNLNWSFAHNRSRNCLTFNRWKQLLHVYYTRKSEDYNCSGDY